MLISQIREWSNFFGLLILNLPPFNPTPGLISLKLGHAYAIKWKVHINFKKSVGLNKRLNIKKKYFHLNNLYLFNDTSSFIN